MSAKRRWVDEGMAVLAEVGIAGITVDGIAARLALTKGSFHHHFRGMGDYRAHLLARFEDDNAEALARVRSDDPPLAPAALIATIPERYTFDRRTDAAVRGWALQDPAARATLDRVDRARLAALTALWRAVVPDVRQAETAAMIPYLVAIGASVAHPPPSEEALADVFALLAVLVPAVGAAPALSDTDPSTRATP
jgi:AcrR family transcriptional regulator